MRLFIRKSVFIFFISLVVLLSSYNQSELSKAYASSQMFQQGEGYQQGAYDRQAIQPTELNWTRQSRFSEGNFPFLKWGLMVDENITSPVIGEDGTIYFSEVTGKVYAVNENGQKKWEFDVKDRVTTSPVISADGTIYIGSWSKYVAISPEGKEKWEFHTGGLTLPVISADGTIYLGGSNKLYAVTPGGSKKWEYDTAGMFASPAIGVDGTIYLGNEDGEVHAIYPNGMRKWVAKLTDVPETITSPLLDEKGTIYIGMNSTLFALDADGVINWSFPTNSVITSTPVLSSDKTIYFTDITSLYAITSDGTEKWTYKTYFSGTPIIGSSGTIFIMEVGYNKIYAFHPDGSVKWKYNRIRNDAATVTSPAIGRDGTIFFGSANYLYAIGSDDTGEVDRVEFSVFDDYYMFVGESVDLTAIAHYSSGKTKDITNEVKWETDSEDVLEVENGKLLAIAQGQDTLFARSNDWGVLSFYINAIDEKDIKNLESNKKTLSLKTGAKEQLNLTANLDNGIKINVTEKAHWTTENESIAIVDRGLITSVGEGKTIITAEFGGKKVKFPVDVKNVVKKVNKLSVSNKKLKMSPNETQQIVVTAFYNDGTSEDVTAATKWLSTKNSIVSVKSGLITAIAKGSATIKATYGTKKVNIYVTVK